MSQHAFCYGADSGGAMSQQESRDVHSSTTQVGGSSAYLWSGHDVCDDAVPTAVSFEEANIDYIDRMLQELDSYFEEWK